MDSQIVLDLTAITEDGSEDFSSISHTHVNRTITSSSASLVGDTLDQCFPTAIRKVQGFESLHSSAPQLPLPAPRRRPGRPCKSRLTIQSSVEKRPTGRSLRTARRQTHNDSAMRSRTRLNAMIDDLWSSIPTEQRVRPKLQSCIDVDMVRDICRADKVEIAISYMNKMQKHLKSSFDEVMSD